MLCDVFDRLVPVVNQHMVDHGQPKPFQLLDEVEDLKPNHGLNPLILWIPKGGPVEAHAGSGADGVHNPRGLYTRKEGVDVFMYGKGFRNVEPFMNHYVACLRAHLTARSFQVRATKWGKGWPFKTTGNLSWTQSGCLCILDIEIRVPFTEEERKTVTITTRTVTPVVVHATL